MIYDSESIVAQALRDPIGIYGTPEGVLCDARLSAGEKRIILKGWEMFLKPQDPENPDITVHGDMLNAVQSAMRKLH